MASGDMDLVLLIALQTTLDYLEVFNYHNTQRYAIYRSNMLKCTLIRFLLCYH